MVQGIRNLIVVGQSANQIFTRQIPNTSTNLESKLEKSGICTQHQFGHRLIPEENKSFNYFDLYRQLIKTILGKITYLDYDARWKI